MIYKGFQKYATIYFQSESNFERQMFFYSILIGSFESDFKALVISGTSNIPC